MKKPITYLTVVVAVTLTSSLFAQQTAQYTQYVFNKYAYNPAWTGSEKCIDARFGGRYQWVGFEGAPTSYFASAHTPLKFKKYRRARHGAGVYIEQDAQTHFFTRTTINLSYAYHKKVHRDIIAAAGVFVGLQQYKVSFNNKKGIVYNPSDPAVAENSAAYLYPDIMPGVLVYNKKFYLGLAIKQIYPMRIKNLSPNSRLVNHYHASGGVRVNGAGDFTVYQSAMFKMSAISPPAIDLTMMLEYKNSLRIGGAYRVGDAASAILQYKIFDFMNVGYAFDFPLSKMRTSLASTHELMIAISTCGAGGVPPHSDCPAYQQ